MEYTISITNQCNLHCSYCYETHLNSKYGSISNQVMHDVSDFINNRNDAGIIYIFGGEPLLYKEKVKYLCNSIHAKKFVITTNGTLLDEVFIRWCVQNDIIINMSHDGGKYTERSIDSKILDEKLKLLLRYQPETLIQLVYTQNNLPYLYDNIMYLKSLGVKKISATMDAFLIPDDINDFSNLLREQWKKIAGIKDLYIYELALKKHNIRHHQKTICELCKKKLFINWDGKFYPCVQFQNIPEYYCGNLSSGIYTESVKKAHPEYSVTAERCEGCEISLYCRNSCACRKMATTGSLTNISEAACLEEQVQILTALEMMVNEK